MAPKGSGNTYEYRVAAGKSGISVFKKATIFLGRIIAAFGIFFAAIGGILFISFVTGGLKTAEGEPYPLGPFIILFIIFFGGGVGIILGGRRVGRSAVKHKKYLEMVTNGRIYSIDAIATECRVSPERAIMDLQRMIDKGDLSGYHIDQDQRRLICGTETASVERARTQQVNVDLTTAVDAVPKMKTVMCKGCGAQNKVIAGQVCECEYCGSPLS